MEERNLVFLKGPNGYYYIAAKGPKGDPGDAGKSSMQTYIAYASDWSGSNISLTQSDDLPYISIIQSPFFYDNENEILGLFQDATWHKYMSKVTLPQINTALANYNFTIVFSNNTGSVPSYDWNGEIARPAGVTGNYSPSDGDMILYICNSSCSTTPRSFNLWYADQSEFVFAVGNVTGGAASFGNLQSTIFFPRVALMVYNSSTRKWSCQDQQELASLTRRIITYLTNYTYSKSTIDEMLSITSDEDLYYQSPTTEVTALSGASGEVEPGKVYSLEMTANFILSASTETDYGEAVMFVEPGSYTFSVAPGITLSATMSSGNRYRLLVSWTPYGVMVEQTAEWAIPAPTTGTLTVNHTGTAPTGAQWSVDNGTTWRDFGTSATLDPDSYTVTFKAVTGYTAPSSQSVTITAGGTETVSAEYTEQSQGGAYTVSGASASSANGTYTLDSGKTGYGGSPVYKNANNYYLAYAMDEDSDTLKWYVDDSFLGNSEFFGDYYINITCASNDSSAPPTSGWSGCTVSAN